MSKLTNEKKRAIGERLYINEGVNGKTIANDLDVSEQTVSRWKKGRNGEKDWDTRRAEVMSAPHKIKELLINELKKVAEGEKSTIDADALAKINKVIESVSGKVSVQLVLSVIKEFDNWMADQDPDTAILFLDYHKQFILHKAAQE